MNLSGAPYPRLVRGIGARDWCEGMVREVVPQLLPLAQRQVLAVVEERTFAAIAVGVMNE